MTYSSVFGTRNIAIASISISNSGRHRLAWMPVDAGNGSSPCSLKNAVRSSLNVCVVALDVAQIASRAHDVVPGAPSASSSAGDVLVGALHLRAEVADVHAYTPCSSMLAVPEISRIMTPFRSMRMPRENELGLA